MSSLWVPHPRGEEAGEEDPLAHWEAQWLPASYVQAHLYRRAEATRGSLGNLCKCQTTQISLIFISPSLKIKPNLLQTACNRSSYIPSSHKNKPHALSQSLCFKPAQITSDLGSSCFNSALQAHSSCARHEQQTFCLTCGFSSSSHSFKTKLFREDFTAFSAKKDIFSLKSTSTNNSTWHEVTGEAKALSLHCEMNLQTSTTYSPHQEAPSALFYLLLKFKHFALCF